MAGDVRVHVRLRKVAIAPGVPILSQCPLRGYAQAVTNSGSERRARAQWRQGRRARTTRENSQLTAAARRRLSVGERRDELINAALELLSSRAATEVSMDDVAASAGASRALIYHYFGSKQELYLAALQRAAGDLTELLDPGRDGPPARRLAAALSRYFDYVEDHAAGYIALMHGRTSASWPAGPAGQVGKIVDGVRQVVLGRILEAIEVTAPGPVLRITLRCWLACVETAGLDWLANRDLPRATLEGMLIAQLIALLQVAVTRDGELASVLERLLAARAEDE
jgi:AcrR family transcriptional regulator